MVATFDGVELSEPLTSVHTARAEVQVEHVSSTPRLLKALAFQPLESSSTTKVLMQTVGFRYMCNLLRTPTTRGKRRPGC